MQAKKHLANGTKGHPTTDWNAVKWRKVNLDKLPAEKRTAEVAALEKVLSA